jgi:hypothetical protein
MIARASRVKTIALAAGLLGGLATAGMLFFFDPARGWGWLYPQCTFHRLTGLDCPGCGSLRALHQLLHGQLLAALRLNAFLILSLPVLGWAGFRLFRRELKGGPAVAIRPLWWWLYLAAWVAFGILRNLPALWPGAAA